jgi:ParB family chromosome partitioning protein
MNAPRTRNQGEWYTPKFIIDLVVQVMGHIDLDPASCEAAQRNVQARMFFDEARNGLTMQWRGRVWLNPPSKRKQMRPWISKLRTEWNARNIEEACVLVTNATETQWFQDLWDASLCFVQGRISFEGPNDKSEPAHGSILAYFGPRHYRFGETMTRLGPVFEFAGGGLRKYRPHVDS